MNVQQRDDIGVKGKLINLIGAVRTLMRGACLFFPPFPLCFLFQKKYFKLKQMETDGNACQCSTVPLIFINVLVIGYELILGG